MMTVSKEWSTQFIGFFTVASSTGHDLLWDTKTTRLSSHRLLRYSKPALSKFGNRTTSDVGEILCNLLAFVLMITP